MLEILLQLAAELGLELLLFFALLFSASLLIILLSSLDDLFIDLLWIAAKLCGLTAPPLPEKDAPEKLLAILVPAWQEAEVLPKSLSALLERTKYRNFRVFVGSYPNDPATGRAAQELARQDARILPITTPRPGPTCKADCLNALLEGALAWEEAEAQSIAGFILQDAEDLVHPDALDCFNRALDHYDLVQLPVLPIVERRSCLVGGHYLDEFAEMHGKEVPLRALISGIVPGAGVATAYGRRALLAVRARDGQAFNVRSLTEDYDFSHRLGDLAAHQLFLRQRNPGKGLATRIDLVGTREIFPNRIATAVRQKARWILGISFQGWQQLAWQGSLASRYFLLRDRKAVFCGHATLVSSLGLIYSLLQQMAQGLALPPLLAEGDWLWQLAWVNLGFLVHRLLVRHLCVWSVYGWQQLPFVTPRYLVATFVNYLALCRASGIFARHLLTGRPIGWDKTTHAFPSGDPNQRAPSLSRPGLEGAA